MATITKLALQQINTQLAADNADLRARVAQLEGDITRITSVASAVNHMRPATASHARMPQWQIDRAAIMAAAREQAIQSGRVVKA